MKIKTLFPVVVLVVAFAFAGCNSSVETEPGPDETEPGPVDMTLSVLKTGWYESGHTNYEPVTYNPLEAGDVVYEDDYYEIVIESVTEDMIILNVDGALIEPNSDGTINLRADPIEEIDLAAGESIELVSQTMDAGIHLKIAFE